MLKNLILLAMVFTAVTGCKKNEDEGELRVSISKVATVLPIAIQSCEDESAGDDTVKSLSANSAKFTKLTFKWLGKESVEISAVKVKFVSAALQGGKLEAAFEVSNLTIAGGDDADKLISCAVRLGGIKFANAARPITIPGTLTAIGIVTSTEGEQAVTYAETEVELNYDPH